MPVQLVIYSDREIEEILREYAINKGYSLEYGDGSVRSLHNSDGSLSLGFVYTSYEEPVENDLKPAGKA